MYKPSQTKRFLYGLIAFVFILSCSQKRATFDDMEEINKGFTEDMTSTHDVVEGSTKNIDEGIKGIMFGVEDVRIGVSGVERVIPKDSQELVKPHLLKIDDGVVKIDTNVKDIAAANLELKKAVEQLDILKVTASRIQNEYRSALKDREKAVAEFKKIEKKLVEEEIKNRKRMSQMLSYLVIACVIGIGVSGALVMFGNFWGVGVGVACIVTIIAAVTVNEYMTYIAYVGIGLAVIVTSILIYTAWNRRKALKEVISTVEASKDLMTKEQRRRIFGHRAYPGLAFQHQSVSTENLVRKERIKMKEAWEPIINRENDTNKIVGEELKDPRLIEENNYEFYPSYNEYPTEAVS